MAQLYELTFLISPELSGEKLKNVSQEINSSISKIGKIVKSNEPKKINLAYPIQKKKEAFLQSFQFSSELHKIENLKPEIEKNPNILRFLLIKKKEPKLTPRRKVELEKIFE